MNEEYQNVENDKGLLERGNKAVNYGILGAVGGTIAGATLGVVSGYFDPYITTAVVGSNSGVIGCIYALFKKAGKQLRGISDETQEIRDKVVASQEEGNLVDLVKEKGPEEGRDPEQHSSCQGR